MLEGDITFECGHYHYYPEPTPHANCIRQGTYVYEPERDGTPGGPVHHWVRRDGNDNIVGPDSDPSLRVPLEAPESVTGKGYRMPERVRISELLPGPALARTPSGTLEASLRRRLKQELRERNRAERRRPHVNSGGAEANNDIKEDIRGDVQVILEKELRDLMKRKTYQDMTEEEVKREAWRITYAEVNRVLLREMHDMMEETKEILDQDLTMVLERVKEGVSKEEVTEEVKEEVRVKEESE
ncbi:hypothetical protein GE21DRAFT_8438 [Neurospora crassa]|uniref:Uncharacterized protein n=1 Tax=Neurospora crassa (strain ATCC 24698 / 74-OR23-1A / CBS 708.71 / DSM 1257 / FGSC 987) TaxID=367110 RepID=Q7RWA3_NEUCR|nr:hypothetical protein NCU07243 [Neurospora crassa OR74A]EAA26667.1 hypothetical protein NCU07243 [Neurospora crassa OR74A]KHE85720.1 hypothetical protein GE21DRAFT_8438 [Neurospora crassa]|eukprot:XP_955903.1 hypothetical protein NCU07243 [Neurospora crassa OR74A]